MPPGDLHGRQEARRLEAGAVDDHIHRALVAVRGDDAAGVISLDRLGDQADVVTLERRRPDSVVQHHPLGGRRVGRQDLLEEIGSVREFRLQVPGQERPQLVVHGAHGPVLMRPMLVDDRGGQEAVRRRPEQPEPVPVDVVRDVQEEPAQTFGHLVVVVREPG